VAFAVADGAGGLGGGGQAAELVVRSFALAVSTDPLLVDPGWWTALLRAIELARDRDAGESTAVVGVLDRDALVGASVGDSDAWLIGTNDVNVVTGMQHRRPRLGTGAANPVAFTAAAASHVLLVGSDGLFGSVRPAAICDAVRRLPAPDRGRALVELARGKSGRLYDDLGIVLLDNPE
jgi:serine/threonine protein phosphatase PrpC